MSHPQVRLAPVVTSVRFTAAPRLDQQAGLLGSVACELDDMLGLDGIALRRTVRGELRLSFPERVDSTGRRHLLLRPLRAAAWRSMEQQVFDALRRQGMLP